MQLQDKRLKLARGGGEREGGDVAFASSLDLHYELIWTQNCSRKS